jgi:hypothetical protein
MAATRTSAAVRNVNTAARRFFMEVAVQKSSSQAFMATVPINRAVQQQHLNTKPGACQFADATRATTQIPGKTDGTSRDFRTGDS